MKFDSFLSKKASSVGFQFIPIFLLFVFIAYPRVFVPFSHSILGKLVSIMIIVFYGLCDVYYGVLACAIVILYYQTDYAEGMESFNNIVVVDTVQETETGLVGDPVKAAPPLLNGASTLGDMSNDVKGPVLEISIVEQKIIVEEDIIKPKSSNDWVATVWKNIYTAFTPTDPEYVVGVISEPFGNFK
jgi:hypothetical protein